MIVVDTNVIVRLYVSGDETPHARQALQRDPERVAPPLRRSEFRNVLALYLRKGHLQLDDALELVRKASRLLDGAEYEVDSGEVLRLVASSCCSAYDCELVALARVLGVPLVTSDQRILAEFPSNAVALRDFGAIHQAPRAAAPGAQTEPPTPSIGIEREEGVRCTTGRGDGGSSRPATTRGVTRRRSGGRTS